MMGAQKCRMGRPVTLPRSPEISGASREDIKGWALGIPILSFYVQGNSQAIAIHASMLFVLAGVTAVLIARRE